VVFFHLVYFFGEASMGEKADIDGLRDPLTERFGLRQELCRIPRSVKLMPPVVGQPMATARLERYFGCPC
jgi:hypothetical protein